MLLFSAHTYIKCYRKESSSDSFRLLSESQVDCFILKGKDKTSRTSHLKNKGGTGLSTSADSVSLLPVYAAALFWLFFSHCAFFDLGRNVF